MFARLRVRGVPLAYHIMWASTRRHSRSLLPLFGRDVALFALLETQNGPDNPQGWRAAFLPVARLAIVGFYRVACMSTAIR